MASIVPAYVNDGNFAQALQNGCDSFSFPFLNRGDAKSFEARRVFRIQKTSFLRLALMTRIHVAQGYAYLVDTTDPQDIGQGLLEYTVTYASVPEKRNEATSIVYSNQFLRSQTSFSQGFGPDAGDVVEPEVFEIPLSMSATVVYEYFIGAPDVLIAPKVAVLGGRVVRYGGWGSGMFPPGAKILAFDSESSLYKGNIYERRSVQIIQPNFLIS